MFFGIRGNANGTVIRVQTFDVVARGIVFASVLAASSLPSECQAQSGWRAAELRPTPQCSACGVLLEPAGRYGRGTGDGMLNGTVRAVARDGKGRVFIASDLGGPPKVFNSDGKFLRLLGRHGRGPQEFDRPSLIVPLDDGRLVVFDDAVRRLSVYDAELQYASSRRLLYAPYAAVGWGSNNVYMHARIGSSVSSNLPLHVTNANGSSVSSFALPALAQGADVSRFERYHLAADGDVLCASRERNLSLACATGVAKPLFSLTMEAPWFLHESPRVLMREQAPHAAVAAIVPVAAGRIAVSILIADPQWKQSTGARPTSRARLGELIDYDSLYDSVILVIDVRQRSLVSVTRVPQALMYAPAAGFLASVDLVASVPHVALWRVREARR